MATELDYIVAQLQALAERREEAHAAELATARQVAEEQRVKASFLEARDALRLSDIKRARIAGFGQGLKFIVEKIDGMQHDAEDAEVAYQDGHGHALENVKWWATHKLEELGEEPREEGAIP